MKEKNVRSRDVQDQYLELCRLDAEKLLARKADFVEVDCPACGEQKNETAFEKHGYRYVICSNCRSLYLKRRPTEQMLDELNSMGEAARYWATDFYPSCIEKRRISVYRTRAEYVREITERCDKPVKAMADIGAGYGIFLEELRSVFPEVEMKGFEPGKGLAQEARARGLDIIEKDVRGATELQEHFDFCSSLEVLEHVFSPLEFVSGIGLLLKKGGTIYLTSLCCDGFDIQIMWQRHRNVYPVNHINILSLEGYKCLLERSGFCDIEITTPGKLDVDIIRSQMPHDEIPGFLRTMFEREDDELIDEYQGFLAKHKLSSHVWISACKR